MDFINEMNAAILLNLEEFKAFIQTKREENPQFLEQLFSVSDKLQWSVLNYLIHLHQESDPAEFSESPYELSDKIDYVLSQTSSKNLGTPLHQAVAARKTALAIRLLTNDQEQKAFALDQRDIHGSTLLSLVIDSRRADLLKLLLDRSVNVNEPSLRTKQQVPCQPLHQAVGLDFANGVRLLVAKNAQADNRLGALQETPILLAARLGKINSLEALLELPGGKLFLEAENAHLGKNRESGYTAMEEFCLRLKKKKDPEEALKGIAMLFCSGAEVPRTEEMQALLSKNRVALLIAIDRYLQVKPNLVEAFVNRCHVKGSALHHIVYADHSWGSSIRHLFGKPSEAAWIVEGFITKKDANPLVPKVPTPTLLPAAEGVVEVKTPIKLYAEFVRRYSEAYDGQIFTNKFSTMRWKIAQGEADWDTVVSYAKKFPNTRTGIVYSEMFPSASASIVHQDMDDADAAQMNPP